MSAPRLVFRFGVTGSEVHSEPAPAPVRDPEPAGGLFGNAEEVRTSQMERLDRESAAALAQIVPDDDGCSLRLARALASAQRERERMIGQIVRPELIGKLEAAIHNAEVRIRREAEAAGADPGAAVSAAYTFARCDRALFRLQLAETEERMSGPRERTPAPSLF